ncbi:Uncharacterised protein [Mycolicibacterium vanbaalenii]|uniref:Plasmid pRiA4b Orf3-like domain-containing protein n=1 Tax=Mycolicibacterium vanbaalenii TaxID=110539 RepID=A0A5S9RA38_MYCVN|nr:plasmid pRiA4b ORF-3 family protein [Mycolicibacterium vanbaalenii]CAA0138277.1 Uncharacterised protein [Mycolicibacterium vanbaalenii]
MKDRHLRMVTDVESRPDLRHVRRREVVVYRLRVDIDHADPPIWRRIDVRSDVTLDFLHQVLQVAFDWTDSHLHRFSLGGDAFARDSQQFLCPYDVDNDDGWDDDDDGIPAAATRLDETLTEAGDLLHYLYDYGDNWELTIRLDQVLPAGSGCAAAVVVGGERAAPPEDCGHLVDAVSLAEVLPDPTRFEPERINKAFGGAYFVLREAGVDARLVDLVHQLTFTAHGDGLTAAALSLAGAPPDTTDVTASLRAFQWFLDRAEGSGIPLTGAGYLKPADVEKAAKVVPTMMDWLDFGKNNRETHCHPVLWFRECLQDLGLLRKNKGRLLLTKAGEAAQRDVDKLWEHLAGRLVPKAGDKFGMQATLLILAYAAASADSDLPFDTVAALLTELGWRFSDGRPVEDYALRRLPVWVVLTNVTDQPVTWRRRNAISPTAAALAHRALRG